jgi:hypothetical protein
VNEKNSAKEQLLKENTALRQRVRELESEKSLHEQTEKELIRVTRALKALSSCTETLIWAGNVSEFLKEICCDIVSDGGYRLAWIGIAEHDEKKTVRPVAQCGYEDGYLDDINITWADTERGRGPVGPLSGQGHPLCEGHPYESKFCPLARRSSQTRLRIGDRPSVDLKKKDIRSEYLCAGPMLDADEVNLLTELANNVAYGIRRSKCVEASRQKQD